MKLKKTLALLLALVMVMLTLPVGMFTIGAATEEPTIDLGTYDTATEYVIMNEADWLLIAREAQDKDFSGITVKLGADLDFSEFTEIWDEAHAPASGEFPNAQYDGTKPCSGQEIAREYAATVPTLFNEFAGVFDGQNYTIKNAKFEEGGIARKTLDGAEVKNVTFENVSVTDFYDYFAYGIVVGEVKGSFWMENVHVVDSAVHADSFNTFHFGSGAGMIGLVSADEGVEGAYVGIVDCSVDADVACGNFKSWGYGYGTGMIVGTVDSNVDFEISDCTVSGTLESLDWYAGAIGALYVGKEKMANISNITIDGLDMTSYRGACTDGVQSWGSLVGAISIYDNASVTVDRVKVVNTSIYSKQAHAVGGLVGMIQPLNSPTTVGGPGANQSAGGTYGAGRLYAHETVEDASVEISNIYVDAYLWSDANGTGWGGAAGLIAQVGQGNSTGEAVGRVMAGEINVYNCYLDGTYISGKYDESLDTWTVSHGSGGIFRNVSLAEATVNVSDVVVDAEFPQEPMYYVAPEGIADADDATKKAYSAEVAKCVGLIAHGGHVRQKTTGDYVGGEDGYLEAYLNVSDVITTTQGDFNLISYLNRKGGIHYNGVDIGRGDKAPYAPPLENDGSVKSVTTVAPIFDRDGFYVGHNATIADYVISSVEDWHAICSRDDSFEGKTIVLGADIDFGGETILPLFGAGFLGTFDGNGHTISNAVVSGTGNVALIAPTLQGGKITNVNFDNITVTTTEGHAGLISAHNSIWADLEVSKIKATNITVNNSSTGNTGLLIGNHANNGYNAVFTQINVEGTVNASNKGNVGGVVGAANVGGVTQWSKIESDVDVLTSKTTYAVTLGGFAGYYLVTSGNKIEISDVYVTGSLNDGNVSWYQHAGFIGKCQGTVNQDISVLNNVIIDVDMTQACGNSVIFTGVYNGNLVFDNVYTTHLSNNGIYVRTSPRWTGISFVAKSFFNGVSNFYGDTDNVRDSVPLITTSDISRMIFRDADGFISSIGGVNDPVGFVQSSADSIMLGEEITFDVVIANSELMKAMALVPIFDTEVFELVEAKWMITAMVQNIEAETLRSVAAWSSPTDVNTTVYRITLRAIAPIDATTVSATIRLQNDDGMFDLMVHGATVAIECDHSYGGTYVPYDETHHAYVCDLCGDSELFEHEWTAATCTEAKTCTVCGETQGEALGHTEELIPGVAPTCTTSGWTDGTKCSVCGEILENRVWLPANGHTEVTIPMVEPTCTETGLSRGIKCLVCGEILEYQYVIPALGHSEEILHGYDPTCTEPGLTDGAYCSRCGETYVDQEVIPALGHSFGDWEIVRHPTTTQEGLKQRTCSICGEIETSSIPKLDVEEGTATITVSNQSAPRGSLVKVPVTLTNNPGIAGMIVTIKYDTSVMTLVNVENGTVLSTMSWGANIVFNNTPDSGLNGLLATLTFEIEEMAIAGDYTVECIVRECSNSAFESVVIETVNGMITVEDFIYGDVDGNGMININDSILLRMYLANYDYDTGISTVVVYSGADVDGNDEINLNDTVLLNLYLANYDYDMGFSDVVLGPVAEEV